MNSNKIRNAPVYGLLALVSALSALVIVNACGGGSSSSPDSGVMGKDGGGSHGCKAPEAPCLGSCVNYKTDPKHCGGCMTACEKGAFCVNGQCRDTCPAEMMCPDMSCVDKMNDNSNCGQCGMMCTGDTRCNSGMCTCPVAGQTACPGGLCVDLSTDNSNCGHCGTVCMNGTSCDSSSSTCKCPANTPDQCPTSCVNLSTDNNNCGHCGIACTVAGSSCDSSSRTCKCPAGYTSCVNSNSCVNLRVDDNNHCGTCNNVCNPDEHCIAKNCVKWCDSSQTFCGPNNCSSNLSTDYNNCGVCNRSCNSVGDASKIVCDGGMCRLRNDKMSYIKNDDTSSPFVFNPNDGTQLDKMGTTVNATPNDSSEGRLPTPSNCLPYDQNDPNPITNNANVWYKFAIQQDELIYADTIDTTAIDTRLYLADVNGDAYTFGLGSNICNNDSPCGGKGAQIMRTPLGAGTYYIVVASTTPGDFTLRFQHLPWVQGQGQTYSEMKGMIQGRGKTSSTLANAQTSYIPSCLAAKPPVGEDAYWFISCGVVGMSSTLSLCHNLLKDASGMDDGGSFTFDSTHQNNPTMDVISAGHSSVSTCNDNYYQDYSCGASQPGAINAPAVVAQLPRGLNIVTIANRQAIFNMNYVLAYDIH